MDCLITLIVICFLLRYFAELCALVLSALWSFRQQRKSSRANEFRDSSPIDIKANFKCKVRIYIGQCLLGIVKYTANRIACIPSHIIRNLCYSKVLRVKIGKNVVIYKGTIFRSGYNCTIGNGSIIGDDNLLDARGGLIIGENCNFSTAVRIWTAQHDVQDPDFSKTTSEVIVGDHCWLSGDVTILPGVRIGNGCVIASGAVVTKDCEPYGIYAGVPAKRIGERNRALRYQFNGEHNWFM